MASYHLSDEALADLDRLYVHGVLTFGLRQADAYFDAIVARIQEIADQPELYPAVDHIRQGLGEMIVCGQKSNRRRSNRRRRF